MSKILANALVADGLPVAVSMTAANAAARLAGTFTSPSTVQLRNGRICQDADTGDFYICRQVTPTVIWQKIGSSFGTGTAGGDLSGNYPNPSVVALNGVPVNVSALTPGYVLTVSGGSLVLAPATGGGGGSDTNFVYTQSVPAATWVVVHGLGKLPSVTVIDSAGDVCLGDVRHDSTTQLTIRFSAPFAGTATLN